MNNQIVFQNHAVRRQKSCAGSPSWCVRRSRWLAVLLGLCLGVCAFGFSVAAAPITWTNTAGGAWSVGLNWSSHALPGPGDDVLITSAGTYTVTMDVSPTISSLTLGGASGVQTLTNSGKTLTVNHASVVNANGVLGMSTGTVNGTGSLTVAGDVEWNGGASGNGFPVTVQSGAALDIQGSFSFAGPVTNQGTVNLVSGTMAITTNSTTANGEFWNQAGALYDIQSGSAIFAGALPANFHNAGTLRKDIAAGSPTISVFLDNSGTVQSKAGTLAFSSGSNLGGTFQADSGAAIAFNNGSFVLSTPPNFQGPGAVQFTGGSLTLDAFTGSLTLNGISLVGQNTIAATGIINLNGTSLGNGASLTILSNAVLNLQASASFSSPVTNQGTVNLINGNMSIYTNNTTSTGEFWNQAGALFDIQSGSGITSAALPANFHNAGTLRKDVATATSTISVFLDNSGTVQTKTGTLAFSSGSNLGGTFQADSGAAIIFSGGTFVLSTPPNFQGPGAVQFTGGSLTLNAFTGSLTLNGISLVGQNTIAATGIINLIGTSLGNSASLIILSNAVLNLQASASFAGPVTNQGTVNLLNGTMSLNTNGPSANGEFWNQAGALFDIQSGSGISSVAQPAIFHNAGTLRKSANSGTSGIAVNLDNTGTIQAQVGVIGIQGSYTESPSATLAVSLAGLTPGTGFGKIQFTAAPTFAGKFALNTLNGYRPNSGDSFLVISYPSYTGGFTSYNGLDLGGGLQLTPNLASTALTLVASASIPDITGITLSGTNVILNAANGLSGSTYVTLMSTNLGTPLNHWSPIATNMLGL